jgi:hypothetical protein
MLDDINAKAQYGPLPSGTLASGIMVGAAARFHDGPVRNNADAKIQGMPISGKTRAVDVKASGAMRNRGKALALNEPTPGNANTQDEPPSDVGETLG